MLGWLAHLALVPTLVLAGTLPLIPLFMVLVGLATQARTEARWQSLSLLSAHFLDVVRGLPTLRAHARDGAQAATLASVGDAYRRETMGTLRVAFLSALVLELLAMLGTALVAAIVGVQLAGGHLGLQAGLTVLLLAPELYAPLRSVGAQFHASADGLAATQRLREALAQPAAVVAASMPVAPGDPSVDPVRLEGVDFAYPGGAERAHGDRPLVGARADDGDRRSERLGQEHVGEARPPARRPGFRPLALRRRGPARGRTLRLGGRCAPACRSVRGCTRARSRTTCASDASDATEAELWDALLDAGAAALVAGLPDGLATRVGEGGRGVSAGEAQRLVIARAFVRDAPLLVLDEPTAHLDEASAEVVGEALERLRAGRTTLLIAHRVELAAGADRVVEIRGGRVVEAARAVAA